MLDLPNLDNKTYREMMEEAVSLIPALTDQWTDFNPQDTGVMLLELMASMTEMQNYYLNQLGDSHYQQYLDLMLPPGRKAIPLDERKLRFKESCSGVTRAVTLSDFETLAMDSGIPLQSVHAAFEGGKVRLYVHSSPNPTQPRDLNALYAFIKPHCLLATRLEIVPRPIVRVRIACQCVYNPADSRASLCQGQVTTLLQNFIQNKKPGTPLNLKTVYTALLDVPAVVKILELSITDANGHGLSASDSKQAVLVVSDIDISLAA